MVLINYCEYFTIILIELNLIMKRILKALSLFICALLLVIFGLFTEFLPIRSDVGAQHNPVGYHDLYYNFYVYCQDGSGTKYPIPNAQVHLDVWRYGTYHDVNTSLTTESNGTVTYKHTFENWETHYGLRAFARVEGLPAGQPYSAMSGPKAANCTDIGNGYPPPCNRTGDECGSASWNCANYTAIPTYNICWNQSEIPSVCNEVGGVCGEGGEPWVCGDGDCEDRINTAAVDAKRYASGCEWIREHNKDATCSNSGTSYSECTTTSDANFDFKYTNCGSCTSFESIKVLDCTRASWDTRYSGSAYLDDCVVSNSTQRVYINSTATRMRLKNVAKSINCAETDDTGWTPWMDKVADRLWTFTSGADDKKVCVQFSNNADGSNPSAKCGAMITVANAPTPYPTIHIAGVFKKNITPDCDSFTEYYSDPEKISVDIVPEDPAGVTSTCYQPFYPDGTNWYHKDYFCDVTFDNVGTPGVNAHQNLTLNASHPDYSAVSWSSGNQCPSTNLYSINVDAGAPANPYTHNLYFQLPLSWFKLKDASFNNKASRENIIPLSISRYDTADDTTDRYLTINNGGVVLNASNLNIGSAEYSFFKWQVGSYTFSPDKFTPANFYEYIKARKEFIPINNVSLINKDGIYVWTGIDNPTLTTLPDHKIVLFFDGSVTIGGTVFNPDPASPVAIIATGTLYFNPTVTSAQGIFIANNIDTGTTANQGLKIKGNLVAQSNFANDRDWAVNTKPALFVVFDAETYVDLLPYLSIDKYETKAKQ